MLGLEGVAVPAGFILSLLSAGGCVLYGLINWNRGELTPEEALQQQGWEQAEQQVEENL
jgi:hypothetical protein